MYNGHQHSFPQLKIEPEEELEEYNPIVEPEVKEELEPEVKEEPKIEGPEPKEEEEGEGVKKIVLKP